MTRSPVSKLWFAVLVLSLAGAVGCRKSSSLITSAITEPAGAHCANGGLAVRTGEDVDNDNVVSEAEAVATNYVCNGAAGMPGTALTSLTKVTPEPEGTNCTLGGYKLETGKDTNGNDMLDSTEVTSSEYLCAPETSTSSLVLLNKTFINDANAGCPGGYVRIGYGVDANNDGALSSTEETSSFVTCNLQPRVTSSSTLTVADCTQNPIVLPITSVDLDGRVAMTSVRVISSGSALVFSSGPNGEVRLSPGMHVAGASIEVTLTDDLGATSTTNVHLVFSGTGCEALGTFYGVDPGSCIAVDIDATAGDDRSGPVLTQRGAYYNGDSALIRADLDLGSVTQIVSGNVDLLMGDLVQGHLLSLWSSEWDATTLADGGTGLGITGLLDPDAGTRFEAFSSPEPLDQIVILDETTFQPTSRVALPQPIASTGSSFDVTDADAGVFTFNTDQILVSATDGQALVARTGNNVAGEHGVLYQLINTSTGAVTINRELYFAQGDVTFDDYQWESQEDDVQHYGLHKRGTEYVLTYQSGGEWKELELAAGTPTVLTSSFVSDCDAHNLAIGPSLSTVYFHSEYPCFGFFNNESLLRCDTLYSPNPNGLIDDTGYTPGNESKRK